MQIKKRVLLTGGVARFRVGISASGSWPLPMVYLAARNYLVVRSDDRLGFGNQLHAAVDRRPETTAVGLVPGAAEVAVKVGLPTCGRTATDYRLFS